MDRPGQARHDAPTEDRADGREAPRRPPGGRAPIGTTGGRLAAFVLSSVALATAACGSNGLSKEAWTSAASSICGQADRQLDQLGARETVAELATKTPEAIEILEEELAQLRALERPTSDRSSVDRLLGFVDQELQQAKQVAAASEAGNDELVRRLIAQGDQLTAQTIALAKQLGVASCGHA